MGTAWAGIPDPVPIGRPRFNPSQLVVKKSLIAFAHRLAGWIPFPISTRWWLAGCLWLAGAFGARAELVYDNTLTYETNYVAYATEFGDEITLAGSARSISRFQCEYFGDFAAGALATARIRFYANDGPGRIPTPGHVLFTSAPIPIIPGLNTLDLTGLNVPVPGTLIWTVLFGGLSGASGDRGGLVLYKTPSIGASYDDFWLYTGRVFELYRLGGNPVANFSARVFALPDPPIRFLSGQRLGNGFFEFQLTGPIGGRVEIQTTGDFVRWFPLTTVLFRDSETIDFVDSRAGGQASRFYRSVVVPGVGQ